MPEPGAIDVSLLFQIPHCTHKSHLLSFDLIDAKTTLET